MLTILDVLDNFISSRPSEERDLRNMPGKILYQLGEEVRRFARDYTPPTPFKELHPSYLGGWPSANFWDSQNGSLAMTSLLFSGQLLAKDPISDWFSIEQYSIPSLMSARRGYLDRSSGNVNMVQTRAFLLRVVPALYRLRPLIEKGLIVLVPSKKYIAEHLEEIGAVATEITEKVGFDIKSFAKLFKPGDMPMEDNVCGMLMCAGGDQEQQIRKALYRSAQYFVAEHGLAAEYGFCYTAPFRFESFLCEKGLDSMFEQLPGTHILHAVFNSPLGLYKGLSPELIASLHEDDNFGLFRSNLFQTYKNIPVRSTQQELNQYLLEAEAAMIKPCLNKIEREASSGFLSRIGVELKQAGVRMTAGVLMGLSLTAGDNYKATMTSAATGAATGFLASLVKSRKEGAPVIWKRLHSHGRQVADELPHSRSVHPNQETGSDTDFWGIPEKPSKKIFITGGTIIMDSVVSGEMLQPSDQLTGSSENPYALCPCLSGRKYKFCCKGLERTVKKRDGLRP